MGNILLARAAHQKPAMTSRGALERLFTLMFKGFVYNQIWEDPAVDLAALQLAPHHKLITIASGGCNVLNYAAAVPARIVAVDLNPHHIALTRLKLAALARLPDYEAFFRFFGSARDRANPPAFDALIAPALDAETRRYWRRRSGLSKRRLDMFAHGLYRYGLLGRFISALHLLARLHGKRLQDVVNAHGPAEQCAAFDRIIAPLFENSLVRLAVRMPVSLYGLGIPPAQYDELVASAGDGNPLTTLRERVARLACAFPIEDNYFAWQAFARGYDLQKRRAVPPYLAEANYFPLRERLDRIELHHASMTDFLTKQPARSLNRYVLLDAQDWMTADQAAALWAQIDRTADDTDARVIFRTAGTESPLPKKLPAALLAPWMYREEESRAFHARDRSSIYGGFHLYVRRPHA
jgi:S-adenosylmethionine-diacylglycerol 3-amino-3-carboxypropyl transferase